MTETFAAVHNDKLFHFQRQTANLSGHEHFILFGLSRQRVFTQSNQMPFKGQHFI